ncbi:hypothetical protein BDA96_03G187200 [Sorghum bicolor]|uniref:Uncharacterized protein n=1 Tax=Sorghum bicolor TaxID=4558 RepID=A0A921UMR2_SORBI|nr:hypothetical protein BDA96_03G187200 [Sorghum bicolor]
MGSEWKVRIPLIRLLALPVLKFDQARISSSGFPFNVPPQHLHPKHLPPETYTGFTSHTSPHIITRHSGHFPFSSARELGRIGGGGGKARLPFSLAGGRAGRGRTRRRGRSVRVCAGVARRCATTAASGACGVARGVRVVARHAWGRGGGARRQDTTRRGVRRGGACARLAGGGLGEDEGATGVLTVCRVVDVGLRCGVRLTGRPEWRGVAVRGSSDGGAHGPHRRVAVAESGDAAERVAWGSEACGLRACAGRARRGVWRCAGVRGRARCAACERVTRRERVRADDSAEQSAWRTRSCGGRMVRAARRRGEREAGLARRCALLGGGGRACVCGGARGIAGRGALRCDRFGRSRGGGGGGLS